MAAAIDEVVAAVDAEAGLAAHDAAAGRRVRNRADRRDQPASPAGALGIAAATYEPQPLPG